MKNRTIIFVVIFIAVSGFIIGQNQLPKAKTDNKSKEIVIKPNDGHQRLPIECKRCHSCDFPTKKNPCLIACPRNELITIEH